jgi:hypothetical protein
MPDKRSETSAENGRKGGRPVSEATIKAQLAREYIAEHLKQSLEPIVAKAINDAILGNDSARKWLSDRAWGMPKQDVGFTDTEGNDVPILMTPQMIALAKEYESKLKEVI